MGGALLAVLGTGILIKGALENGSPYMLIALLVYGFSLIMLYLASTLYHLLPLSEKGVAILRRLDHMMIYVLIAGTYTPLCIITMHGLWGWVLFSTIWALALVGFAMKIFWFDAPRVISTLFYVLMGIVVVAFLPILLNLLSVKALVWLLGGGILYLIGAVIYATKLPLLNFSREFGFHEIFHLFILGGSLCHYWFVFRFILG